MPDIKESLQDLLAKFKKRAEIAPDAIANFQKTVQAAKDAAAQAKTPKE